MLNILLGFIVYTKISVIFAQLNIKNKIDMTRINSNLNPKVLSDEMLLAEHREIKRIPTLFSINQSKNRTPTIPKQFTLGTGHVNFFLDKPDFTLSRYKSIYNECIRRGFNITDYSDNWNTYKGFKSVDYKASDNDLNLIRNRISERYNNSKKPNFRYEYKNITKNDACKMLYY